MLTTSWLTATKRGTGGDLAGRFVAKKSRTSYQIGGKIRVSSGKRPQGRNGGRGHEDKSTRKMGKNFRR